MTNAREPGVYSELSDPGEAGRVATVTLDYEARINILNTRLIVQLTEAVESLMDDDRLRVLILRGAGEKSFIGGADINEMATIDSPAKAEAFISRLHGVCAALRRLPVPVIARISGYCLGAGLEIAAACDLRIASEGSLFGMPEVKVGIPSVIEAALLPRLVGWGKARELVYTGESIGAEEALQCGLIERLVPHAKLDDGVERWVGSILQAGPNSIRLQKALIRKWESLPIEQAIEAGIRSFGEAYRTEEPRSLMKQFLNRRRSK